MYDNLGAALISSTDATAIVTSVTGVITDNWPAVAILVGFGVGLKVFSKLANGGLKGRVRA